MVQNLGYKTLAEADKGKGKSKNMDSSFQTVRKCEFGLYMRHTIYHKWLFHGGIQIQDKFFENDRFWVTSQPFLESLLRKNDDGGQGGMTIEIEWRRVQGH